MRQYAVQAQPAWLQSRARALNLAAPASETQSASYRSNRVIVLSCPCFFDVRWLSHWVRCFTRLSRLLLGLRRVPKGCVCGLALRLVPEAYVSLVAAQQHVPEGKCKRRVDRILRASVQVISVCEVVLSAE